MKKLLATAAIAGGALFGLAGQASADGHCGSLTMAEMNWASAELMANVDKIILEEGYGCEVEIVAGDTMPTFTSMNEKGQPDIAGELWINAVREPLFKAMDEGRLMSAVEGPITQLGEGWWVPPHTAKAHPEILNDIDALLARPDLFPHPEDPSKGAFVGCPAGWGCQLANNNLYRAFEMEKKGWLLVDPGSAAGLDASMAKAAERGENWFGYYWAPTAVLGKYPMVRVDVPAYNAEAHACNGDPDCANPVFSAYPAAKVATAVSGTFAKENPEIVELLSNVSFTNAQMGAVLAWRLDNNASYDEAAVYFLMNNADVWGTWLNDEAKGKLAAILGN